MIIVNLTEEEKTILLEALEYLETKAKKPDNITLFKSLKSKFSNSFTAIADDEKETKVEKKNFEERISTNIRIENKESNIIVNNKSTDFEIDFNSKKIINKNEVHNDKYIIGTKVVHYSFGKGEIINANDKEVRVRFLNETMNFGRVAIDTDYVLQIVESDDAIDLEKLMVTSDEYYHSREPSIIEKIAIQHRILIELAGSKNETYTVSIKIKHLERLMNLFKEDDQIEEAHAVSLEILKLDSGNKAAQNIRTLYGKSPYYRQESKATDFQYFLCGGGPDTGK